VALPSPASQGDDPYVFVCYAHQDSKAIYREIARLNSHGVNVWCDEGIGPRLEWTDELANALLGCTKVRFSWHLVLLLPSTAAESSISPGRKAATSSPYTFSRPRSRPASDPLTAESLDVLAKTRQTPVTHWMVSKTG
jgi:hypothetical protein